MCASVALNQYSRSNRQHYKSSPVLFFSPSLPFSSKGSTLVLIRGRLARPVVSEAQPEWQLTIKISAAVVVVADADAGAVVCQLCCWAVVQSTHVMLLLGLVVCPEVRAWGTALGHLLAIAPKLYWARTTTTTAAAASLYDCRWCPYLSLEV